MTLKQPFGHIEKVDLRKVWVHDAQDFTKWPTLPSRANNLFACP